MKKLGWILAYFAFLSLNAQAGLPPTTSKGSTDASPSTTFNLQFPEHRITHTGTTASVAPPKGVPNFIGQSASWAVTNPDDRDLEASVGNWLAFANTVAGSQPDNGMTGGSPTVTCARSTTTPPPLDGAGSLLITKGASNLQGNGCSVVFNVQPAYQGGTATITAALNVSSGSIVQGDVKLFIYDVTNSKLITPSNNDVLSGPTLTATFPLDARAATPANQQYRLGIFFASTSATAVNLQIDNFSVSPGQAAYGMAGSNLLDETGFTFNGFGTVSSPVVKISRIGDRLHAEGYFVSGTAAASAAGIVLPTKWAIDTSKYGTRVDSHVVGKYTAVTTTASPTVPTASRDLFYDGSTSGQIYFGQAVESAQFDKRNGNAVCPDSTGDLISFNFDVPIAGWDAGVSISPSQTYKISSYLASGTRVTGSAPTSLGQYRSYLRAASTTTWSETNAAPAITPNNVDGIRLYNSGAWATADPTGQPSKYEIFVGKNKNVRVDLFGSAGKTSPLSYSPLVNGTTTYGTLAGYDPSTGILTLLPNMAGSSTTMFSGLDMTGTGIQNSYVEITVSDNALSVGADRSFFSKQVAIGTAQTSDGSVTSTTYADLTTNQPTLTFTATANAKYKVWCSLMGDSSTTTGFFRINNSSGGATVNLNQDMGQDAAAAWRNYYVYQIVTLSAGVTYTFTLQGKASSGSVTVHSSGPTAGTSIVAEQME